MPAPENYQYSPAALVAAHTAFRDLLDAENAAEQGAAVLLIRAADATVLAAIPLDDPCGTVNTETGQLVFDISEREESAPASGDAAYGEFVDAAGGVHLAVPCQAGTEPVQGRIVMNTLAVVQGGPVEVLAAVVG